MDVIGQSGTGLIGCHGHDSIPPLGPSPQGNNAVSTPSVCGHCLSSNSSVGEYISPTSSVSQPIFFPSYTFLFIMSSGNNTNSANNSNGANKIDWQCAAMPDLIERVEDSLEVQIAKFNEQLHCQCEKLMKRAAEQEAQRKAREERRKAEEEAKRVAEEEARKLAEEEAKKKGEEDAQKRAEFQAWWKADSERKAREKAEAKAVAEAMRVQIAQKVGQGKKPKVRGMEPIFSLTCSSDF